MRIDRTAEEHLNGGNVLQFLRDNHVMQFTQGDCQKLINYYDSNQNGFLSYQDFLQMVLPCEDLPLRLETSNRPFFRVSRFETLPVTMEVALANVVQQELRVLKQLEKLTYDLERRPDYSALSVYRCIDRMNEGRIDTINLERFFKENGLYLQDRELHALIRRIDTTADQTVSY
jgi:Ca2+-binding EF-hand superfamily protein